MAPIQIALFDVDGVLIIPGGYRRAATDTIHSALDRMNLAQHTPDKTVFECFESLGITNEWDMIPLYLCIVLNAAAKQTRTAHKWHTLKDVQKELSGNSLELSFDTQAQQKKIGQITKGQPAVPSELILDAQDMKHFPFKALIGLEYSRTYLHQHAASITHRRQHIFRSTPSGALSLKPVTTSKLRIIIKTTCPPTTTWPSIIKLINY